MITPHQTNKKQKNNMTKKQCLIHLKSVIKCSFLMNLIPQRILNWKGPGEIIDINYTNAKIKFKNKIKVLNVAKLKHFYENVEKSADNLHNLIKSLISLMKKSLQTSVTFLIKRKVKDPSPGRRRIY